MKIRVLPIILASTLSFLASCKERTEVVTVGGKQEVDQSPEGEQAAAARLKEADDPVYSEIMALRREVEDALQRRDFDELGKTAARMREGKETFRNGRWKLNQFYGACSCENDAEAGWQARERLLQDWVAAKPESITPRVALAAFLVDYAWHARGSGYVNTVTERGWQLFAERLGSALKVLVESQELPEKDIYWWYTALQVARGQGWPKEQYDQAVEDAKKLEPKFWGVDVERAFSLLPRWYGAPGDWEKYAAEVSARPDGLGAETYARIVIYLRGFHSNIFHESHLDWPKLREGLALMRERYPETQEMVNHTAMLATMAGDRALAKEMFDQLGDTFFEGVWDNPERFIHFRNWVITGHWR